MMLRLLGWTMILCLCAGAALPVTVRCAPGAVGGTMTAGCFSGGRGSSRTVSIATETAISREDAAKRRDTPPMP